MNFERIIQLTEDGSYTISIPGLNVTYHSKYGAIQESAHIFIKEGLEYLLSTNAFNKKEPVEILEVGFGTGLNTILTLKESIQLNKKIIYDTVEPFPISVKEAKKLNYSLFLGKELQKYFIHLHECSWNEEVLIHPSFLFRKLKIQLQDFCAEKKYNLIYFDAFDPIAQPELWTQAIFKKMLDLLTTHGILLTYCSKGVVRRAMQSAGFSVEKLPGPKGKREIVRAMKPGINPN